MNKASNAKAFSSLRPVRNSRRALVKSGFLLALAAFGTPAQADPANDFQGNEARANEARAMELVQEFAGELKPRLTNTLSNEGPVAAIAVCAEAAPDIASQISKESGWGIKRVSSRNRNPEAAPDTWEMETIRMFEEQSGAGESAASLTRSENTPEGFRFAKAQLTEPMCLMCHGHDIAPDVAQALAEQYPADKATGYEQGEVRGIFSLVKRNWAATGEP